MPAAIIENGIRRVVGLVAFFALVSQKIEKGEGRIAAAVSGTRDVLIAVVASTLTGHAGFHHKVGHVGFHHRAESSTKYAGKRPRSPPLARQGIVTSPYPGTTSRWSSRHERVTRT